MKINVSTTFIAATMVALGFGAYPTKGTATEPDSTADMLRRACTVAAGRFEEGWIRNGSGVQWGEITSCVTESVRLTCQGDVCRASAIDRNRQSVVLIKHKASTDLGLTVLPEREEFDRVLSSTAMY